MDVKKIKRLEKELKELYRIRYEMQSLAAKGSEVDQKNLKFAQRGIDRCLDELKRLKDG